MALPTGLQMVLKVGLPMAKIIYIPGGTGKKFKAANAKSADYKHKLKVSLIFNGLFLIGYVVLIIEKLI